ncbi:hypothetical protein M427DRAFT_280024 [Gonapodya prolifera JEL478]|uniref:DNA replication checkpoint mediator MRC1 domain-containing protein n=1 Tax=Gonapodya prolifera (strain JEL478) TaxID=1344416 RepID=A0A139AYP5_GONPJ|nr:hypothetical protein M427DRAFT_280024 [Gonapodya prolifera JEL478]|eukprot:KXS21849.1 hypothetical protein M427DRAFT_280024 [Gonapodya prolifera JEL478]
MDTQVEEIPGDSPRRDAGGALHDLTDEDRMQLLFGFDSHVPGDGEDGDGASDDAVGGDARGRAESGESWTRDSEHGGGERAHEAKQSSDDDDEDDFSFFARKNTRVGKMKPRKATTALARVPSSPAPASSTSTSPQHARTSAKRKPSHSPRVSDASDASDATDGPLPSSSSSPDTDSAQAQAPVKRKRLALLKRPVQARTSDTTLIEEDDNVGALLEDKDDKDTRGDKSRRESEEPLNRVPSPFSPIKALLRSPSPSPSSPSSPSASSPSSPSSSPKASPSKNGLDKNAQDSTECGAEAKRDTDALGLGPGDDDMDVDFQFSGDEADGFGTRGGRNARASSKRALLEMKKETDRLSRLSHVELVPTVANKRSLKDMLGMYMGVVGVKNPDSVGAEGMKEGEGAKDGDGVSPTDTPDPTAPAPETAPETAPAVSPARPKPRLTADSALSAATLSKGQLPIVRPTRAPLSRTTLRGPDEAFELVVVSTKPNTASTTTTAPGAADPTAPPPDPSKAPLSRAQMELLIESRLRDHVAKAREAREAVARRRKERAEKKKREREEEEEKRREKEREEGKGFRRLKKLGQQNPDSGDALTTAADATASTSAHAPGTPAVFRIRSARGTPAPTPTQSPAASWAFGSRIPAGQGEPLGTPRAGSGHVGIEDVGADSDEEDGGPVGGAFEWGRTGAGWAEDVATQREGDSEGAGARGGEGEDNGDGLRGTAGGLAKLFFEGTQVGGSAADGMSRGDSIFDRLRAAGAEPDFGDNDGTPQQAMGRSGENLAAFWEETQVDGSVHRTGGDESAFSVLDKLRAQADADVVSLRLSPTQHDAPRDAPDAAPGLDAFFEETQVPQRSRGEPSQDAAFAALDNLRAEAFDGAGVLSLSSTQGIKAHANGSVGPAFREMFDLFGSQERLLDDATGVTSDTGAEKVDAENQRETEPTFIRLHYSIENSLDPFEGSQDAGASSFHAPAAEKQVQSGWWAGPAKSTNALMPPEPVQEASVQPQADTIGSLRTAPHVSPRRDIHKDREAMAKEKERQRRLAEKQRAVNAAIKKGGSILNFFGKPTGAAGAAAQRNDSDAGAVAAGDGVREVEDDDVVMKARRVGNRKRLVEEDDDVMDDVQSVEEDAVEDVDGMSEDKDSEEEAQMADDEEGSSSGSSGSEGDDENEDDDDENEESPQNADSVETGGDLSGPMATTSVVDGGVHAPVKQMQLGTGMTLLTTTATGPLEEGDDAPKPTKHKLKKKSIFLATEAEEEEDEFMGLGGQDGELDTDEEDAKDLEGLIAPETGQPLSFDDVVKLHRQQMKDKDETEFNNLLNDVTSGNLRKRRRRGLDGKGFDLSDGSDEDELFGGAWKKLAEKYAKRRLNDDDVGDDLTAVEKYAANPETSAFAKVFEWGNRQDEDFIGDNRPTSEMDVPETNDAAADPASSKPARIDFVLPDGDVIAVEDDGRPEEDHSDVESDGSGESDDNENVEPHTTDGGVQVSLPTADAADAERLGRGGTPGPKSTSVIDVDVNVSFGRSLARDVHGTDFGAKIDFLSLVQDQTRIRKPDSAQNGDSVKRQGVPIVPNAKFGRGSNTANTKKGSLLNYSPSKLHKLAKSLAKGTDDALGKPVKTFTFGKQEPTAKPVPLAPSSSNSTKKTGNSSLLMALRRPT